MGCDVSYTYITVDFSPLNTQFISNGAYKNNSVIISFQCDGVDGSRIIFLPILYIIAQVNEL